MFLKRSSRRLAGGSIVLALALAGIAIAPSVASANPYADGTPAIVDGAIYTFTVENSGLNMDVAGGSGSNGALVQQWTPNALPPQNWILHLLSDGSYTMQNQQSQKYLDVDADSLADGARIQQYDPTSSLGQHWFLDYTTGGYFKIRGAHSGKSLEVPGASTTAGTALDQRTDSGGTNQRWKVTQVADGTPFQWGSAIVIQDQANFTDAGTDAQGLHPGVFGSQFPRMTKLADESLLIAYTIYDNNGYTHTPSGGMKIQFKRSTDSGRTWSLVSTLAESGRDIDNGQIVQRSDGTLVMAYRSVRWGESYRILTRTSSNSGVTWSAAVTVDSNEGTPGSLASPPQGVYEPYMNIFSNGDIGILYANEKYSVASPAYAQVISERISTNGGASWGAETFAVKDLSNSASRPGMPVWAKLADGTYGLVYELCGSDSCNVWIKKSGDGRTWATSMGARIPSQVGGPFLLAMTDGRLVVTSNSGEISVSRDLGGSWYLDNDAWGSLNSANNLWPQLVQTGSNEIAAVISAGRAPIPNDGTNIQIKFSTFGALNETAPVNGGTYTFKAQHSGLNMDVAGGSGANGATVQQYTPNGLPPQNWILHLQSDGSFLFENQQSAKVLDVDGDSLANGARVQQYSVTGSLGQHWYLDYIGGGNYRVREAHSNQNLDVTGGSLSAGTALEQWPENGARAQRWILTQH